MDIGQSDHRDNFKIKANKKAFNGKINCLITYGEANDPEYNPLLKENQKEYIYHSELVLNNQ